MARMWNYACKQTQKDMSLWLGEKMFVLGNNVDLLDSSTEQKPNEFPSFLRVKTGDQRSGFSVLEAGI